jgi:hypothetical protein
MSDGLAKEIRVAFISVLTFRNAVWVPVTQWVLLSQGRNTGQNVTVFKLQAMREHCLSTGKPAYLNGRI